MSAPRRTIYTVLAAFAVVAGWCAPARALHPMPHPGSLLLRGGGGWGFNTGMFASREKADAVRAASERLTPDSTELRLDHFARHAETSFMWFAGPAVSVGVTYLYRTVTQTMPGSELFGDERHERFIRSHLAGPACAYWKNGEDYNISLAAAAYYATGTLWRSPILSSLAYTGSEWLPALAAAQHIEGYGFGLRAELYKFSGTGVFLSLGAGYDFIHYRVPAVSGATYPAAADCGDLYLLATFGYASNVWQAKH